MIFLHKSDEKGASLIETAIVIPVFVLLFVSLIEVASFLYDYIDASRLSYEIARRAGGTQDLEPGPDMIDGKWQAKHKELYDLASLLLDEGKLHGSQIHREVTYCMDKNTEPLDVCSTLSSEKTIVASVTLIRKPILPPQFLPEVVTATAKSPYLFKKTD